MFELNKERFYEEFTGLLSVDSTTGQYRAITAYLKDRLAGIGYGCEEMVQGGVVVPLGGEGHPMVLASHVDDIGAIVRHIKTDGTIRMVKVGGLHGYHAERENVRVHTSEGKVYSGTIQRAQASVHVTQDDIQKQEADFDKNLVVVLDEDVRSAEDVRALGIEVGDFIAIDPRPQFAGGYVKSRFVDDKAMSALQLCLLRELKEKNIPLSRKVYSVFTMYEELGHGMNRLPEDVEEFLAVDIGCIGPEQTSDEKKVSIFCMDSRFPYHQGVIDGLVEAAKASGAAYVKDIFTPHYGSDGDTAVMAGNDIRHGAIGPGTLATHGYERTHIDGLENTYRLMAEYITGAHYIY